ncbi:MAG TPA: cupin domain-containing protein [Candidatus Udaeobacter sp.]|nr:cupin domain-containing protein [Candidatus Udaeobacter sp.]
MSKKWEPDDSTVEGPAGVDRIREALKRHNISTEGRVVTSREPGMDLVRLDLMRENMAPGITSWQLPIWGEGPSFYFITSTAPGAVVPEHAHKRDLFRVVISGSMYVSGVELKAGDWMYVPKGVPYSYSAAFNPGVISLHSYG